LELHVQGVARLPEAFHHQNPAVGQPAHPRGVTLPSAKLQTTFRKTLERADLNPYLYEHVNIREQASWVHKGDHEGATEKAIRLARAGVEKILRQDEIESIHVDATKHVLVIGGGPAGIKAALDSAGKGLRVTLVEKSDRLGGHLHDLDTIYPSGENASKILCQLLHRIQVTPLITVALNTTVTGWNGFVGNFSATLSDGLVLEAGAVIPTRCASTTR